MNDRTFCVLLFSFLMLLGGVSVLIMKKASPEQPPISDAAVYGQALDLEEESIELLLPTGAEVMEVYGSQYSEEYKQWSMCEEICLKTNTGSGIYAPLNGIVKSIESIDGAETMFSVGSRVTIECGEAELIIYPVYGVCAFAGSRVTQENLLGTALDRLYICAWKDGRKIDPMSVATE